MRSQFQSFQFEVTEKVLQLSRLFGSEPPVMFIPRVTRGGSFSQKIESANPAKLS